MKILTLHECEALARKLGLRYDGAQDPVGAAAATGDSSHERHAFTCVREGAALGVTFYAPLDATAEEVCDRWNVKLAEVFAGEFQKLKADNARLEALVDNKVAYADGMRVQMNALRTKLQTCLSALEKISNLDPHTDSDEGFNEWGEAECFNKAKAIARETTEGIKQ